MSKKYTLGDLRKLLEAFGYKFDENDNVCRGGASASELFKSHRRISAGLMNLILFFPLLFNVPIIVFTPLNPCLYYVPVLTWITFGLFVGSFVTCFSHLVIYDMIYRYCNSEVLNNHIMHTLMLFSAQGATLAYYNLYAYEPCFLWFGLAFIAGAWTLVEYYVCLFQRHNYYFCESPDCQHQTNKTAIRKYTYEDVFTAFAVLFTLLWVGTMLVPMALNYQLFEEDGRSETACKPLSESP